MIKLRKLRDLELGEKAGDEHSRHISAASSLVRVGDILYVVADDERQLGIFPHEAEGGAA